MKRFLMSIVCLVSLSAYGESTLQIPVFVDGVPAAAKGKQKDKTRSMPVRWLNAKIKKAGLKPIPESVEITNSKDAKQFDKISEEITAAAEKLGPEYKGMSMANESSPGENYAGDVTTCYTGRASDVPGLISDLTDVYYSEQLGLWGWKYKSKTNYDASLDDGGKWLEENAPKVWKNWRGDDDTVLILTHEGDDGDDIEVALIKRCEN